MSGRDASNGQGREQRDRSGRQDFRQRQGGTQAVRPASTAGSQERTHEEQQVNNPAKAQFYVGGIFLSVETTKTIVAFAVHAPDASHVRLLKYDLAQFTFSSARTHTVGELCRQFKIIALRAVRDPANLFDESPFGVLVFKDGNLVRPRKISEDTRMMNF